MSYTYLLEGEEEYSAASFSDIPQYVLSRLNLTAEKSCCSGSGTESCQSFPSGTMCEHSTGNRGEEKLMSSAEGSLAKTFHAPGKGRESQENAPGYGEKWRELSVKFDPDSHSWKTHRCLWEEDLPWSSVTLPRWGMMRGGVCLELVTQEHRTRENDVGYSLPTPTATDYKRTPMKRSYAERPLTLGVPDDLAKWAVRESGLDHARLVPDLWEWAMGWPEAWTDLKPSETDKFQQWLLSHGGHYANN